jgi:hypothetical protein
MTTQAPPRTHCPTCGAKLHRTDLSLCAYCATPLAIADQPAALGDETTLRLKRLREHAGFAAATEFTPVDRDVERVCGSLLTFGTLALLLALVPGLGWAWNAVEGGAWLPWAVPTVVLAAAGLVLLARRPMLRSRSAARPMLRRPAIVVVRRSETDDDSGSTTYFFTLRFDDGSEGEFVWPGQGTAYEPLANGLTGIAYTRGTKLIDFRRLI